MARPAIDPQKAYAHLKNKVAWANCDKCGWNWPEKTLNFRDGRKVCRNHPDYLESSDQKTARIEKAAARLAKLREPVPRWPHPPEMRNVSGVAKITPNPLSISRGSVSFVPNITLTGRNLSASDVFTFSSSGVAISYQSFTAIDAETRGNAALLGISASPFAPLGACDLVVNGDVFQGVIQVKA